jgi:hypothetical protein
LDIRGSGHRTRLAACCSRAVCHPLLHGALRRPFGSISARRVRRGFSTRRAGRKGRTATWVVTTPSGSYARSSPSSRSSDDARGAGRSERCRHLSDSISRELLTRLKANGVSLVLVQRADRLARDLLVGEIILGQFRDAGVRVIEAEGGKDLTGGNDGPTRKLIRQVLGAVAEFEKSETAIKQRAARDRKSSKQRRRCEGRKRFGSTPSERAAVERMLELRRKPKSRGRLGGLRNCQDPQRRGPQDLLRQAVAPLRRT